jgi:hypothetical protein
MFGGNAEGHLAWLRGDAKRFEKSGEVRIVPVVENDEAGIDRNGLTIEGDGLRVGMAAGAGLGFIQRDVVPLAQQPGS